ncbi:MAG: formylglycine-generating enzyme family protein [Cyclobacteriaceae bacterium]|nr:formylglycine-generating enzyme family protein [Cyclobacteriaceae bacterium]
MKQNLFLSLLASLGAFLLFFSGIIKNAADPFEFYSESLSGSSVNIAMTPIHGGQFMMGSPENEPGRKPDEGPQHSVTIDDFWMSTLEITWEQYELFLYRETDRIIAAKKGNVQLDIDAVSGATMPYVNFNRPGHPVVDITQYAASTFCEWLTAKTGHYYRLPTEAEWEYACRAGSTSAYSFVPNEDLTEYAWFDENSNGSFRKGGLKEPNKWGLYDMHGNVAEWVLDSYDPQYYTRALQKGQHIPYLGTELYPRVVRGGSWKDGANELRSASRGHSVKEWKRRDPQFPKSLWWHTDATHVGFRVVRPKKEPSPDEMKKYWVTPIEEY